MIKILKVEPVNLKLKSISEQNSILEGYKCFLKQCNFDFQILIQTQKVDVSKYINKLKEMAMNEESISDMIIDYIDLIKEISNVRGGISKKFYIIVNVNENQKNSVGKIIDGLKMCGNTVEICNEKEVINIFKNCFK